MPQVGFSRQPSVRTQYAPRAVAPADTSAAQGIAGLGQVLSGFFGAQANIQQKYDQLEHNRQLEEIQIANRDQKMKAIADVERGQEVDPALAADRDYADTYTSAIASKHATESANKFKTEVLSKMGPDADFDAAFNTFTAEETKNGSRTGTGNDLYDATFLKTLKGQTDNFKASHEANAAKFQQAKAIDAHQSMVATELPNLNPASFNKLLQGRQAVMPWAQASEVQASVWSDAMAAAKRPEDINKLSVAMEDPAFGDGKRSFRDLYPEASDKLQRQMLGKYQSDIDIRGQQAWDDLDARADQALQTGDVGAIVNMFGVELEATFRQHGGNAKYQQMRGGLQRALNKAAEEGVGANRYAEMLNGNGIVDRSDAAKYQDAYFKREGIDPRTDPVRAAQVVAKMGVLNDNVKGAMSIAMADPGNPQGFAAAFQFYRAIENSSDAGPQMMAGMMDAKSGVAYDYVKRQLEYGNVDPATAAMQFQEISKQMKGKDRPTSQQLLDTRTAGEGDTKLWSIITDEMSGVEVSMIPQDVKRDLMETVKDNMIANKGSAKDAAAMAMKRILPNMRMYPGGNGDMVLGRNTVKGGIQFGKDVFNPDTGKTENTVKTYTKDVASLPQIFSSHPQLKDLDDDDFSLDATSMFANDGVYLVRAAGRQVQFGLGESYSTTVNGKVSTVTLPRDPKEAKAILETTPLIDHDRFGLALYNDSTLMLTYKPGFTEKRKTLKEKEAEYVQPTPTYKQGRSAAPAGGLGGRVFGNK